MFVIWLIYNRLATLVRSALETHVGQGLPFRFQFESLFPQRFPLSIVSRRLGRLRLRGSSLRSRAQAAYPADDRAVVFARCLPIAWRRDGRDHLIRWNTLDTGENGRYLIAIRGSRADVGVSIRGAGDRHGVDLDEMFRASRGPINVVSQRRIGGCIGTGDPRKSHGVLRMCR